MTSRTSAEDRAAYAHKLQRDGMSPKTRLTVRQDLNPATGKAHGGTAGPSASRDRHNASPDKRRTVIPAQFTARITDKILKRLYDELRAIDAREFSFAAAYLLRAVIEQAAKIFCKKNKLGHDADVHVLMGRVADKLKAEGIPNPQLKVLRVMASDRDSRVSPETLGAFVHGGQIPTGPELARRWDSLEHCLQLIFARIK